MYEILRKNWDKNRHIFVSGLVIGLLLLLAVVFKSNEKVIKKSEIIKDTYETTDLKTFKKFIFDQIKSPFTNINYEIKKGDTIQKILKKYEIPNNEIQIIINQYKKYGNPNKLLAKNKIDIIFQKKFEIKITLY